MDFTFDEEIIQIIRVTGNRIAANFSPAEGSRVGIVYINASNGLAAIQNKLNEIAVLSDAFVQRDWVATAKTGCDPGVRVVVTVRNDVPVIEEP